MRRKAGRWKGKKETCQRATLEGTELVNGWLIEEGMDDGRRAIGRSREMMMMMRCVSGRREERRGEKAHDGEQTRVRDTEGWINVVPLM